MISFATLSLCYVVPTKAAPLYPLKAVLKETGTKTKINMLKDIIERVRSKFFSERPGKLSLYNNGTIIKNAIVELGKKSATDDLKKSYITLVVLAVNDKHFDEAQKEAMRKAVEKLFDKKLNLLEKYHSERFIYSTALQIIRVKNKDVEGKIDELKNKKKLNLFEKSRLKNFEAWLKKHDNWTVFFKKSESARGEMKEIEKEINDELRSWIPLFKKSDDFRILKSIKQPILNKIKSITSRGVNEVIDTVEKLSQSESVKWLEKIKIKKLI